MICEIILFLSIYYILSFLENYIPYNVLFQKTEFGIEQREIFNNPLYFIFANFIIVFLILIVTNKIISVIKK